MSITGAVGGITEEPRVLKSARVFTILIVVLALASCGGEAASQSEAASSDGSGPDGGDGPTGSIVSVVTSLDGAGQDPLTAVAWQHKPYWDEIHDYLIEQDVDGNLVGALAESWEPSEDGLVWTFVLREGVLFHDGSELTAEDVAWSINRLMFDPNSVGTLSGRAEVVESVEADGNNLVITTNSPQATLPTWFAKSDGGSAGVIYSQAAFEEHGEAIFAAEAMGTGPFELVSVDGQQSADLTAFLNDDRNDWQKERTPQFKDLRVVVAPDASTRVSLLQTGDADLAPLPISAIEQVQDDVELIEVPAATQNTLFCIGYSWNPESPCDDIAVREALSIAIDRQGIADALYQGYAEPSAAFMSGPGSFGNPEDLAAPPFDPDRAEQLLTEAGFGPDNPLVVNIMVADIEGDFPMMPTLAEAIAANFEAVGIDASVEVNEEELHKQKLFDLQLPGHPDQPTSPVTLWMRGTDNRYYFVDEQDVVVTDSGSTGAAVYDGEAFPEMAERIRAVAAEFDLETQAEMFAEYHRWMAEEWNQIPLLTASAVFGVSDKIASWDGRVAGKGYVHNHWSLAPAD
jgi:ABC-type transport system substrate-binding protein